MTEYTEVEYAIARSMGGWNEDTSEPDISDPRHREMLESHWKKVNKTCLETARGILKTLKDAGFSVVSNGVSK